jgi:inner membrane protein
MPSVVTHGAVAVAAGMALAPGDAPGRLWPVAVLCSVIPDADGIAFLLGIPYGHFVGHRGFLHSPFFALLLSFLICSVFFRDVGIFSKNWLFYFFFLFLLTASHGILDAFTNGGLGVALLSPFDNGRYFFPWTPIEVSPIGIRAFFSAWGLSVLKSELLWVWLPSGIAVVFLRILRAVAL